MTWHPGQPVLTASDEREWQQWRRNSKREAQRQRRATNPRIDFYPDEAAYGVILRSHGREGMGANYSTVINRIVAEWAEWAGEVPPE